MTGIGQSGFSDALLARLESTPLTKEKISELLEEGISPNTKIGSGLTLVHLCARAGNVECLSYLLEHGGDPNIKHDRCSTALHFAAGHGSTDCVEFLLKTGRVSVNVLGGSKQIPLHFAVHNGHLECVKKLLEYGADINHMSGMGTPLDLAKSLAPNSPRAAEIYKVLCEFAKTIPQRQSLKKKSLSEISVDSPPFVPNFVPKNGSDLSSSPHMRTNIITSPNPNSNTNTNTNTIPNTGSTTPAKTVNIPSVVKAFPQLNNCALLFNSNDCQAILTTEGILHNGVYYTTPTSFTRMLTGNRSSGWKQLAVVLDERLITLWQFKKCISDEQDAIISSQLHSMAISSQNLNEGTNNRWPSGNHLLPFTSISPSSSPLDLSFIPPNKAQPSHNTHSYSVLSAQKQTQPLNSEWLSQRQVPNDFSLTSFIARRPLSLQTHYNTMPPLLGGYEGMTDSLQTLLGSSQDRPGNPPETQTNPLDTNPFDSQPFTQHNLTSSLFPSQTLSQSSFTSGLHFQPNPQFQTLPFTHSHNSLNSSSLSLNAPSLLSLSLSLDKENILATYSPKDNTSNLQLKSRQDQSLLTNSLNSQTKQQTGNLNINPSISISSSNTKQNKIVIKFEGEEVEHFAVSEVNIPTVSPQHVSGGTFSSLPCLETQRALYSRDTHVLTHLSLLTLKLPRSLASFSYTRNGEPQTAEKVLEITHPRIQSPVGMWTEDNSLCLLYPNGTLPLLQHTLDRGLHFHELLQFLYDSVRIALVLTRLIVSAEKNEHIQTLVHKVGLGFFAPFLIFIDTNNNEKPTLKYCVAPLRLDCITLRKGYETTESDGSEGESLCLRDSDLLYQFLAPEQKTALQTNTQTLPVTIYTIAYQVGILLRSLLLHPTDSSPLCAQTFRVKPLPGEFAQFSYNIISQRHLFEWTLPAYIPFISYLRFAANSLVSAKPSQRLSLYALRSALGTLIAPSPHSAVTLHADFSEKYTFLETVVRYCSNISHESLKQTEEQLSYGFGPLGWSFLIENGLFELCEMKSNDQVQFPEGRSFEDFVCLLKRLFAIAEEGQPHLLARMCAIMDDDFDENDNEQMSSNLLDLFKKALIIFIESRFPFLLSTLFDTLHSQPQIASVLRRINAKYSFAE